MTRQMRLGAIVFALTTLVPRAEASGQAGLPLVLKQKLSAESLAAFKQGGVVKPHKDGLRLESSASLSRDISRGPQGRFRLGIGQPPRGTLRLWLLMDDATDFFVRLTPDKSEPRVTIELCDTATAENGSVSEVSVKRVSAPWAKTGVTVTYSYGLITVDQAGETRLQAYIQNSTAPIRGFRLECEAGTVLLQSIEVKASARSAPIAQSVKQESKALEAEFLKHFRAGQYQQALKPAEQLLALEKKVHGEQHLDYAVSLNNLSFLLGKLDEHKRSIELQEESAAVRQRILGKRHPMYATSLNNLAMSYQEVGRFEDARQTATQALQIRKTVLGESHPHYTSTLNNLGLIYHDLGADRRAEELLQEALQIRGRILGKQHRLYASSLVNVAAMLNTNGKPAEAAAMGEEAIATERKLLGADHPALAASLRTVGRIHRKLANYARAEEMYQEAARICQKAFGPEHSTVGSAMHNLGMLYVEMNDFARAEPMLRKSSQITRKVRGEKHPSYATSLDTLALYFEGQGDLDRAASLIEEALSIRKEALGDSHPTVSLSMNNLASVLRQTGQQQRRRALLEEVVRRDREGRNRVSLATSLSNLASALLDDGDLKAAERMFEESLAIHREAHEPHHPDIAIAANNLATFHMTHRSFSKAESLLLESERIWRKTYRETDPRIASAIGNRATLEFLRGNFKASEELAAACLKISSEIVRRNAVVQSERQQLIEQTGGRPTLDFWISVAMKTQQPAHRVYEEVLNWKGAVTVRQRLYRALSSDPEVARLFARLRAESQNLAGLSQATLYMAPADATQLQKQLAADERMRWERDYLRQFEQVEQLEREIAARSTDYRKSRLSVSDLQARLPRGTVLVDFLEFERRIDSQKNGALGTSRCYLSFVLSGDSVQIATAPADAVDEAIGKFRDAIEAPAGTKPSSSVRAAGKQLRSLIWEPIERHLDKAETVFLSPDAALGTVPFNALPGRDDGYLIEDYKLAVVPVPRWLARDEHRAVPKGGLLVVGDVDYGKPTAPTLAENDQPKVPAWVRGAVPQGERRQWQTLPGFADELAIVRDRFESKFAGAPVTTLRGRHATEAGFVKEAPLHYNLHVVTHGFFAGDEFSSIGAATTRSAQESMVRRYQPGVLSGLVLAGANAPLKSDRSADGVLTSSEIEALPLNSVDLAVLSACETGLGRTAGGEGLLGLQRAFAVAGVRSTIASLWKVDDQATLELMRRFYRNYWDKGQSKIDALRNAQLEILRNPKLVRGKRLRTVGPVVSQTRQSNRTHPSLWAAFVLSTR